MMNSGVNLLQSLWGVALLSSAKTRSISAENPTGEKGGGAKELPDASSPASKLGKGWKVRPCITLPSKTIVKIAEIVGPGVIQHIWMTFPEKFPRIPPGQPWEPGEAHLALKTFRERDCVLRIYWDEEESPSVEVPLGDFFALAPGVYRYNVSSLPIVVNPYGGLNCYFPMPFKRRCRVMVENQSWEDVPSFFYQITYALVEDLPENVAYFHAQWRRSVTSRKKPEHVILDGVTGQGHYVGTFLVWSQLGSGWFGEGEMKFYIDGDTEYPTICGTGTEDYFGAAWGFKENYSTLFLGCPFFKKASEGPEGEVPIHCMYRWHILDPIRFEKDLRVIIQALGWWPNVKYQPREDDIASTAYWYQREPHSRFPEFPSIEQRWPR